MLLNSFLWFFLNKRSFVYVIIAKELQLLTQVTQMFRAPCDPRQIRLERRKCYTIFEMCLPSVGANGVCVFSSATSLSVWSFAFLVAVLHLDCYSSGERALSRFLVQMTQKKKKNRNTTFMQDWLN